jgi:AcrR family transcriptional regulator
LYVIKWQRYGGTVPAGVKQLEQAASTRAALVVAARDLFVRHGYFATGTEELVNAAGVTRGALYHHFSDKRDLFRAVFNTVGADVLAGRIGALRALPDYSSDPWERLKMGLHAFLRTAAEEPEVQRITLIDGPAVLGWPEWNDLERRYALGRIEAAIVASGAGATTDSPANRALAHLLLGVINAGALLIANSGDPTSTGAEVEAALDALLAGLRRPERAQPTADR